jgi:MraZ protein
MFKGKYEHKIDSKGRLSLPRPFRQIMQNDYDSRMVITNFDICLVAYPLVEWQLLKEKVKSLPAFQDKVLNFMRFFYAGATECQLDKQGRILIPAELRQYAELKKDVVVVGVANRIEIWNKERWQGFIVESKAMINEFAHQIIDLTEKL